MTCELERQNWEQAEANLTARLSDRDQAQAALDEAQAATEAAASQSAQAYQAWLNCIL